MLEDLTGLATANLAAWRLVTWISLLIAAGALADYARNEWRYSAIDREFLRFSVGLVVVFTALGLHQFYWWRNEVYVARGNCHSTDVDYDVVLCVLQHDWQSWNAYVTPFAYMIGGLFLAMAIAPLLRMRSNLSWRAVSAMSGAWLLCVFLAGLALAMR